MTQLFKVGQKVRIKSINQNDPCYIPTDGDVKHAKPGDYDPEGMRMRRFIGKRGTVKKLLTDGQTGESPDDPLYVIAVPSIGTNGFWAEELEAA